MFILRWVARALLIPIVIAVAVCIDLPIALVRLVRWQFKLRRIPEGEMRQAAFHEVGHALVAWRSPYHRLKRVVLAPRLKPWSLGYCTSEASETEENRLGLRSMHVVYAVGGLAAELVMDEVRGRRAALSFHCTPDFKTAVLLALSLDEDADASVPRARAAIASWVLGRREDAALASAIAGYLDRIGPAVGIAAVMVAAEKPSVERLARLLLERRVLYPDDLRAALGPSAYETADRGPV